MAREVRFATQFLRLAVVALPIVLGGGPGCGWAAASAGPRA
jgi:hypothetical protein